MPGRKFIRAVVELLALRLPAGGGFQHQPEDAFTHFLYRRSAVENLAAVHVHVIAHPAVHVAVRGKLERRHRLAAKTGTAPGRKADEIGSARNLPGGRNRIVAGRVHEDEAALRYG